MNDTVLSVKNLSANYGGQDILSDITFDLRQGEILGIVGESGSGKSTLLRAVFPMKSPGLVRSGGEIAFKAADERKKLCGQQIGMIYQNPKASFNPIRSYRKQFIETLKSHGKYKKENFENSINQIFEKLNLSGGKRILDSCPFEMSGGMNQRIAIALSILLEPVLLLADEPTSALDVTSQNQVVEELLRIREYYHTSMIIVTHNIGLISQIADKVGVMHQGKIIEMGTGQQVLKHPGNSYAKNLFDAVPQIRALTGERPGKSSDLLLNLKQVSKEYRKNRSSFLALSQVDMQLKPGEIFGIVGESGSGKSTLLKQIAGIQRPTDGAVMFRGKNVVSDRTKTDFRSMQMIFQNAVESFDPRLKIRHSISETLKNLGNMNNRKERDEKIDILMELVGLKRELADRYPSQLSGGQCQRAAIARAISVHPDLLLCDEITSSLDVSVQAEIIKLLMKLAQDFQMAVIFVSHDIALVSNICEKIMVLKEGKCIEAGSAREIIKNPKNEYTKMLLALAQGR